MGPVPIGSYAVAQTPDTSNQLSTITGFYNRTPAERLLTGLQILAALFAITLAVKMLFFKNS